VDELTQSIHSIGIKKKNTGLFFINLEKGKIDKMLMNRIHFEGLIKNFRFRELFNELGWENVWKKEVMPIEEKIFQLEAVAEKRNFVIFTCQAEQRGVFPDKNVRRKIEQKVARLYFEHLIIFIEADREKQVWQIRIREPNKPMVLREVEYYCQQTPQILVEKLKGLFFTLDEEEKIGLVDVKQRVSESFSKNAERVTKQFYDRFKKEHTVFLKFIEGIENRVDREWYGSLMLNRLMFIYFIQKKGFLDQNENYLRDKLKEVQGRRGKNHFYSFYKDFLLVLFHKGLGRPERDAALRHELGNVPYLNGGLFDEHEIEKVYNNLNIEDEAFEHIFDFFDDYNWHLDTRMTASGKDINPDVIGYIFEKYINDRAAMGAYYTKEDITDYISKNTIIPYLFDRVKNDCPTAFEGEDSVWQMLRENADRYIYEAVRKGTELELPAEIARGLENVKERTEWNKVAAEAYALPTEIWREVVERRQRYFEVKGKIENGEVQSINDFITYNLDIKQFAQDVASEYESAEFVAAFYEAVSRITVLDPTCGSGAFLFAALNILEPLYEACLERMRTYVAEEEESGGKRFGRFKGILAEIENHPNQRYYIYKSIILNNLYGVDIMNEAVEIAKLRLFLKMVATVDVDYRKENLGLEPLPDVDFNIRTGNSLVGFATKKELDDALGEELDLYDKKGAIYEMMELVARAFKRFKESQLGSNLNYYEGYKIAKGELGQRLKGLNEELNQYLAVHYYGKNPERKADYRKWKESHQPFHWFAEFYEIIHERGGFDVVIGNPPYIEYSKIRKNYKIINYKTENCGNLYTFILERSFDIIKKQSRFSMIMPMSVVSTKRIKDVRKLLISRMSKIYISNYSGDAHPSILFNGVKMRLSIVIGGFNLDYDKTDIYTTNFIKWYTEAREHLFNNIKYIKIPKYLLLDSLIPKIGNKIEIKIMNKIFKQKKSIKYFVVNKSEYSIYSHRIIAHFVKCFDFIPYFWNEKDGKKRSDDYKIFYFPNLNLSMISNSILNSTTFYFYYLTYSDAYHCGKELILSFPCDLDYLNSDLIKDFYKIHKRLIDNLMKNSERRKIQYRTGWIEYDEFYPKKSKKIINEIDRILAKHYAFTDEELDFIINYDIKYRMGKELNSVE